MFQTRAGHWTAAGAVLMPAR